MPRIIQDTSTKSQNHDCWTFAGASSSTRGVQGLSVHFYQLFALCPLTALVSASALAGQRGHLLAGEEKAGNRGSEQRVQQRWGEDSETGGRRELKGSGGENVDRGDKNIGEEIECEQEMVKKGSLE